MFLLLLKTTTLALNLALAGALASAASLNPKCGFETPVQMLNRSSAVFSGRVVEIKGSEQIQIVRFAVTKSWKGARTTDITLTNVVHHEGPFFREGHSYLVFAWGGHRKLRTGACSGTVELDSAGQTIRELDRWRARRISRR
jgi:hypothetical protein